MQRFTKYILIIPVLFLLAITLSPKTNAYEANCPAAINGWGCNINTYSNGPCNKTGNENCCICTASGWEGVESASCTVQPGDCGPLGNGGGTPPPSPAPKTGTPCDSRTEICNTAVPGLFSEPEVNLSNYLNAIITFVFIIGFLIFFFMLIFGGVQWITSGGDKQGTQSARGRITAALIGLAILAFSWAAITLAEKFFGIHILNFSIPHP